MGFDVRFVDECWRMLGESGESLEEPTDSDHEVEFKVPLCYDGNVSRDTFIGKLPDGLPLPPKGAQIVLMSGWRYNPMVAVAEGVSYSLPRGEEEWRRINYGT